ncbi:hypothetical protein [Streptomyces sp. SudanB182_2057]|uniref:hypothetical protein n=1 Tax=Streptomyces sp. SudanB182_2057 TaxID=3035281 RepID=UPI003F570D93
MSPASATKTSDVAGACCAAAGVGVTGAARPWQVLARDAAPVRDGLPAGYSAGGVRHLADHHEPGPDARPVHVPDGTTRVLPDDVRAFGPGGWGGVRLGSAASRNTLEDILCRIRASLT